MQGQDLRLRFCSTLQQKQVSVEGDNRDTLHAISYSLYERVASFWILSAGSFFNSGTGSQQWLQSEVSWNIGNEVPGCRMKKHSYVTAAIEVRNSYSGVFVTRCWNDGLEGCREVGLMCTVSQRQYAILLHFKLFLCGVGYDYDHVGV
jgi:hypothetical protein